MKREIYRTIFTLFFAMSAKLANFANNYQLKFLMKTDSDNYPARHCASYIRFYPELKPLNIITKAKFHDNPIVLCILLR